MKAGLEVREIRGVGWSVDSYLDGRRLDRHALQPSREEANSFASRLHDETKVLAMFRAGEPSYLKLAEVPANGSS